ALALALWAVRGSRHHPLIPFALAAFVLAYLPISNLFSLNATVAEHWLYLPSAWLLFAAALSLATSSLPIRPILALLTLWFFSLATQTFLRQAAWLNQRSLFENTIANGGDSPRIRMNLANLEASEHHQDLALAHYRNALQRSPHQAIIWLGYAKLLLQLDLFPQAEAALQEAQKSPWLTPDCLEFQAALRSRAHHEDRSDLLLQALAITPHRWSIRKRYADYLASQAKPELALAQLRFALEIAPYRGSTWRELASLLESLHRPDLALIAFTEAANRDVHDSDSRQQIARLTTTPQSPLPREFY
ncbi:MAG: tetratricopeptide repeat protein, partial [Verrucomicrobia bacterium]|nr:tetratricopeptide repeat protein [Verrucomicrobiota bacterium]